MGLSEAYILVKGTINISGAGVDIAAQNVDARNKQVTLRIARHLLTPEPK